MMKDQHSATLLVNAAACSGVLHEYNLLRKNGINKDDEKANFINYLSQWILACLGAHRAENIFWAGWDMHSHENATNGLESLGKLCKAAPILINEKKNYLEEEQKILSMYNCYQKSLSFPRTINLENYDDHLTSKTADLKTSEMVFELHFKFQLIDRINQWIQGRSGDFVIADVGAGNGTVLEAIGNHFKKLGRRYRLIAIDPSAVAREECRAKLYNLGDQETLVVDGTLADIRRGNIMALMQISKYENVLIVMKGVMHDRAIEQSLSLNQIENITPQATYRNQNWTVIDAQTVQNDLVNFLNDWRKTSQGATIMMMESHMLSFCTINQLLNTVPVLPTYVGHALTAQYLITCEQHFHALQESQFDLKYFHRLCPVSPTESIMSLAQLN